MNAIRDLFVRTDTEGSTLSIPELEAEEPAVYHGPRKRLDYPMLAFMQDAIIVSITLVIANILYETGIARDIISVRSFGLLGIAVIMWAGIFNGFDLYRLSKYYEPFKELRRLAAGLVVTMFGWAGFFAILNIPMPRMLIIQSVLVVAIGTLAWRLIFQISQRIPHMQRYLQSKRTLIIGTGKEVGQLLRLIEESGHLGLEPVAILTDRDARQIAGVPVLGDLNEDVRGIVAGKNVESAIVMLGDGHHLKQSLMLGVLDNLKVQTWVLPDYFNLPLRGQHLADMKDMPLVDVTPPRFNPIGLFFKRTLDIVTAGLALIVVAPVMAAAAVAIKADSPGPIFFFQERVGKDGKSFKIFKFRSMVVDAEAKLDDVAEHDETGRITNHKRRNDPRVTRVGRFIRATSIDELPQLFNVLRGDMTLVGPRPEIIRLVGEYAPWQRRRFAITQGITGWWQVNGRSERPCHLSTDMDLEYIQNYSFLLDLQILLMTVPAVLAGKGAY